MASMQGLDAGVVLRSLGRSRAAPRGSGANAASSAKTQEPRGPVTDGMQCENLRGSATGGIGWRVSDAPSSHKLAEPRGISGVPGQPVLQGESQVSLGSQSVGASVTSRLRLRTERLMRRGWPEGAAVEFAGRINSHPSGDHGVVYCVDCRNFAGRRLSGLRCLNASRSGFAGGLAEEQACLGQRCAGFAAVPDAR
jgi:hypothetical protein